MDSLRRLVKPVLGQRDGRPVRRIAVPERTRGTARLRGANRALAEALIQLRENVPLNWGQVEDDSELLTLARLQGAAQEARAQVVKPPPADKYAALLDGLKLKLPPPTYNKPKQEAPVSLAGFSERVQVLTQAEDNVKIDNSITTFLLRTVVGVAVVGVVLYGLLSAFSLFNTPVFTWIELRNGDEIVSRQERQAGWQVLPCRVERQSNPLASEYFQPFNETRYIEDKIVFDIPELPPNVTVPDYYRLDYVGTALAPCKAYNFISEDPGAMIRMEYKVVQVGVETGVATATPGNPLYDQTANARLVVYVANRQPLPLSIDEGTWREVRIPQANGTQLRGAIWRGTHFRDRSGVPWSGEVIVLMVEHGDEIMVIEGNPLAVPEAAILEIAAGVRW